MVLEKESSTNEATSKKAYQWPIHKTKDRLIDEVRLLEALESRTRINNLGKIVYSPENRNNTLAESEDNERKYETNDTKIVFRANDLIEGETQQNLGSIECCSTSNSYLSDFLIKTIDEVVKEHEEKKTTAKNVEKIDLNKEIIVNNDEPKGDELNEQQNGHLNSFCEDTEPANNNTIKKSPQQQTEICIN